MGNLLKFPSKANADPGNVVTFHEGQAMERLLREKESKTKTSAPQNEKPIENNNLTMASILEEEIMPGVRKREDVAQNLQIYNGYDNQTGVNIVSGIRRCTRRILMPEQVYHKARVAVDEEYKKIREKSPSFPPVYYFHDARGFMTINTGFNSSDYFGIDKIKETLEKLADLADKAILK
jgi:hypothetical protein